MLIPTDSPNNTPGLRFYLPTVNAPKQLKVTKVDDSTDRQAWLTDPDDSERGWWVPVRHLWDSGYAVWGEQKDPGPRQATDMYARRSQEWTKRQLGESRDV